MVDSLIDGNPSLPEAMVIPWATQKLLDTNGNSGLNDTNGEERARLHDECVPKVKIAGCRLAKSSGQGRHVRTLRLLGYTMI